MLLIAGGVQQPANQPPDVTKDSVKQTTRATPKPDVSEASPSTDEIKQKQ